MAAKKKKGAHPNLSAEKVRATALRLKLGAREQRFDIGMREDFWQRAPRRRPRQRR